MSCTTPNNSNQIITLYSYSATTDCGCANCDCAGGQTDAKCVFYTGPNLPCALINTNESMEDILIKIDQRVCSIVGNYAIYNKGCIDDAGAIGTEQEFVEAICEFTCTLRTDFDAFTDTTYTAYQTAVDARFDLIEGPSLTCASAGITAVDSLATVYSKYCTKFAAIDTKLSLVGVLWDSCYTVDPDPVSIAEGFNTLISQVCDLKTQIAALDAGSSITFNNTGTCLPGVLTSTDTLEDTVNKIKTRLCTSPAFDINALTWGCIAKPSLTATDLQAAIQALLTKIDVLSANATTFSADFVVAATDAEAPCAGKTISLAATSILDKYVAVNGADGTPGTLVQKLQAGTGVTFDVVTVAGKLIINAAGGSATDQLVKVNVSDTTAGYLEDKLEGSASSSGITTTAVANGGNTKVTIGTTINYTTLWTKLLEFLDATPAMKAEFCERVTSCLPDCVVPPNVTVIYNNTSETTTSTTTTTTTTP